jgi:hypothetical protein
MRSRLRLLWVLTSVVLLLAVAPSGRSAERPIVSAPLAQQAWSQGEVHVIVRLSIPWVPEPSLPSAAHVANQRRAIGTLAGALKSALRGFGHRVKREYDGLPFLALVVDPHALQALGALPSIVDEVVEDELSHPQLVESVPLVYQAGAPWPGGVDGTGTVVAVLDTGVEKTHPFLSGKVVAEACFSTTATGTTNLCPGGVDSTAPGSGVNCTGADGCDHGTHVAGTAAGGSTGVSGAGVAPGAKIWAIQVFSRVDDFGFCGGSPPCVGSYTSDQIAALSHVFNNRTMPALGGRQVAAVNASLGSGAFGSACDGDTRKPAIDNLRAARIATVVASGNDGLRTAVAAPACISTSIAVGSTGDGSLGVALDAVSSFSNIGPHANLILAPGQWINSSVPVGTFQTLGGTSMAAPHVTGAFAALRQDAPDATVATLFAALRDTGLPVLDTRSGGQHTKPRIRIGDLLLSDIQFQTASFSAAEGDGAATVTVVRGSTAAPATVNFATSDGTAVAGTHYTATSGTLTFDPGESSKTFTVALIDNTRINADRTVNLKLSSPTGGLLGSPATAVLTIVNDDNPGTISFASSSFSVAENATSKTITVVRSGTNLASGVTVPFSTANGSAIAPADYTAKTGTLTFGAGQTSQTFTVAIVNDTLLQGDRTFTVSLGTPTSGGVLGSPATADVTIVEDDTAGTIQFSTPTSSVNEGAGSASIQVTRTGTSLARGVSVQYAASSGTATAGSDFTAVSGTLTFGAGVTSMTFLVPVLDDTAIEPAETVNLALTLPAGSPATLGAQNTATLTIQDNDAPLIQFSVATQSVSEGATAKVVVTRARQLGMAVSADYQAIGGTATGSGMDYTLASGTVSFGAGVTSKTILIPTVADTLAEGPETIVILLQNPSAPATLGPRAQTTVTITDNDQPGTIQFGLAAYSVAENALSGSVDLVVTRSGTNLASNVTVDYAVTGGSATGGGVDYTLAAGTLTFNAGQTSRTIPVGIVDDDAPEGNETVVVTLSNPTAGATLGARATTTLTILDSEQAVAFSRPTYSVTEGTASIAVPIVRAGPTPGGVTVTCQTAGGSAVPGSDYTPVDKLLTFAAGSRTVSCVVPVINDTIFDGPRTVNLALSVPPTSTARLAPQSTAVLTIEDNDAPGTLSFAVANFAASEPAGTTPALATITVTRAIPAGKTAASGVTVDYATSNGTATAGQDYTATSSTLTFAAGQLARSFTVPILHDTLVEGPETVLLTLSSPSAGAAIGSPNPATLTIKDNDVGGALKLSAATYTVAENGGQGTITVLRSGGAASEVTVQYATADDSAQAGIDYAATAGTLTFAAGETSKSFAVPILDNDVADAARTFKVVLAGPGGGGVLGAPATAAVTITDDEVGVRFGSASYSAGEAATSALITVQRTGPKAAPATVQYATGDGSATAGLDYQARSGTLTIPAGATSATFSVPLLADTLVEGDETVNLTLSNPAGALLGSPNTAALTIKDNDNGGVIAFALATAAVTEGKSVTLTVKRTGTNLGSNVSVDYAVSGGSATNGSDFTLAAGTLTFGATQTTKTIVVAVTEDGVVEGDETFVVTLNNAAGGGTLGSPASTTVTIRDAARVRFYNEVVLCSIGCQSFTARLTTGQGRVWDSLSGVASPYQPVPEPKLTNLVVSAVGFGLSVSFPGAFTITPSRRYLIVFTLNAAGSPVLLLSDEGSLAASAEAGPAARPFTLMPSEPVPPGGRFQRFRAP